MLFKFQKKNNFGYHPMLSAYAVERWKDNLLWWFDNIKKYYPESWKYIFTELFMLLEVRNGDWTQEKIRAFSEFQDFYASLLLKECFDGDVGKYTLWVLGVSAFKENSLYYIGNLHYQIGSMGCAMAHAMCIRVGDLAVVPCHRCAYEQYVYGWLKQDEEGNITGDIKANNTAMGAICLYSNMRKVFPHCKDCPITYFCMRGCMGAQIEYMGDPLARIPCVCDLQIEKVYHAIKFLDRIGGLEYLRKFEVDSVPIRREYCKQEHTTDYFGSFIVNAHSFIVRILDVYKSLKLLKGE